MREIALQRLEAKPVELRQMVASLEQAPPEAAPWVRLRGALEQDRIFDRWKQQARMLRLQVSFVTQYANPFLPRQGNDILESVRKRWTARGDSLFDVPDAAIESTYSLDTFLREQLTAADLAKVQLRAAHPALLYLDTDDFAPDSSREDILREMSTRVDDTIEQIDRLGSRIRNGNFPLELLTPIRDVALARLADSRPSGREISCDPVAAVERHLSQRSWVDGLLLALEVAGPAAAYLLSGTTLGPVGIALGVVAAGIAVYHAAEKIDQLVDVRLAANADAGHGDLITDADRRSRELALGAALDLTLAAANAWGVLRAARATRAAAGGARAVPRSGLARLAQSTCLAHNPVRATDAAFSVAVSYGFLVGLRKRNEYTAADMITSTLVSLPNAEIRCRMGHPWIRETAVIGSFDSGVFLAGRVVDDAVSGNDWKERFDDHLKTAAILWGFHALVDAPIRVKLYRPLWRTHSGQPPKFAVVEQAMREKVGKPLANRVAVVMSGDIVEQTVRELPAVLARQTGRIVMREGWRSSSAAIRACVMDYDDSACKRALDTVAGDDPVNQQIEQLLTDGGADFEDPVTILIEREHLPELMQAMKDANADQ